MPRKKEKQDLISLNTSGISPLPVRWAPQTDEDRYVFYANLVRLKALRLTNGECAENWALASHDRNTWQMRIKGNTDGLIGNSKDVAFLILIIDEHAGCKT